MQILPVWAAMFAISGCRSLLKSFEDTFLELVTVENPNITFGILTLSITVPEIEVFPVWAALLLFPIFGRDAIIRGTSFELAIVKKSRIVVEISTLSTVVPER